MPAPLKKSTDAAELFAISGAFLCLVHCLFLPVLLASLPAVGQTLFPDVDLHLWIVLIAGPISAWLLASTVQRNRPAILSAGAAGLGLLALALFLPLTDRQETAMTVCGSVLLAGAHITNWLMRHHGHRHPR